MNHLTSVTASFCSALNSFIYLLLNSPTHNVMLYPKFGSLINHNWRLVKVIRLNAKRYNFHPSWRHLSKVTQKGHTKRLEIKERELQIAGCSLTCTGIIDVLL